MNKLSQVQKELINKYVTERFQAHTIILFGSAAKEALQDQSDIDIAFLADAQVTPYETFMLAQELADLLGREVDLVDLGKVSTVFKAQIIGSRELLLDSEPVRRQYIFMHGLSEYAKLNEERQCVFDKLGSEGGAPLDQ